jgi:hypothetical protein
MMAGARDVFRRAHAALGGGRLAALLLPDVASCYALRAAVVFGVVAMVVL